jgi:hypothetical protein
LNQNQCTECLEGYSLDGGNCVEDGLSIVAIILIVVGAVLLVGIGKSEIT